jgi:amino-acid N-acetyltransferase
MTDSTFPFVDWFRSSTSYINSHRNKIFVVLLGGETLASDNFPNIVHDLSLLHSLGVKLVLVHGARPQITNELQKIGKTSEYHTNLRVTEASCMDVVKQVVGGLSTDVEALFSMGLADSPMHGADINICRGNFVTAKPVGVVDGIDFQYTGKIRKINANAIEHQLDQNNVVLLSNLGYSLTGEVFNLSAEELATETAIALKAEKLILFIPGEGITDSDGKLISSVTEEDAEYYLNNYSSTSEPDDLITYHALSAALNAYHNNIHRSHLISFRKNGALLQELFTREGNGTLISSDNFEKLREATINDVAGILALIKPLEQAGTLVERSRELLETEIENFRVIEFEGVVIACAALYPISGNFGEVACIASHPAYQNNGYGVRLLASLESEARNIGLEKIFVLTTTAAHWFLEKGFKESEITELPEQKQQLYNFQRNSKVFVKTV